METGMKLVPHNLTERHIEQLRIESKRTGFTEAALIRQAIDEMLAKPRKSRDQALKETKVDVVFRAFMELGENEKLVLIAKMILCGRSGLRLFAKMHGVGITRAQNALMRFMKGEAMWLKPPPLTVPDVIAQAEKMLDRKRKAKEMRKGNRQK